MAVLCPEKYALENFIEDLIKKGRRPSLGIDIHNDDAGGINLATHSKDDVRFIENMKLFENVSYSWKNAGRSRPFILFENGLLERYGIEAMVYELNANWISSLNKMPSQYDWMEIGKNLNEVFYEYFNSLKK